MTSDDFPRSLTGRIIDTAKIMTAVGTICLFLGGFWAVSFGPLRNIIEEFIDEWEHVQTSIIELRRDMQVLQGEDKVIREIPGLTYVSEPVYQGDVVVFNYVGSRTQLGLSCVLQSSQPIFSDVQNTPTPGPKVEAQLQLGQTPTPLRPEFQVPINIRPGRVTVYLVLEYICDGRTVFDKTSVAAFELLEGVRPGGGE